MVATRCIYAHRPAEVQTEQKDDDLSDFEGDIFVFSRQAGLSISDVLGFSHTRF